MSRFLKLLSAAVCGVVLMAGCGSHKVAGQAVTKTLLCEDENVAILSEVITKGDDVYNAPIVALWVKDKLTGEETKLLQTRKLEQMAWYMGDGDRFIPVPIDSIYAAYFAQIINSNPLQIMVEGCPDARNIFSYVIDVPVKKAYYVPSNSGFLGMTPEENYYLFTSYRYVNNPDIGGRYTFIQVFDEDGVMVDSLDLEHLILDKYKDLPPIEEEDEDEK